LSAATVAAVRTARNGVAAAGRRTAPDSILTGTLLAPPNVADAAADSLAAAGCALHCCRAGRSGAVI